VVDLVVVVDEIDHAIWGFTRDGKPSSLTWSETA